MTTTKVDSGLGRNKIPMIMYICTLGVYCLLDVPKTTHVSQEIDQNYGLLKSVFWSNLKTLSQARFNLDKTLLISDLPLLVFGSVYHGRIEYVVEDSFSIVFSAESNLSCWKKCGDVLLAQGTLMSDQVQH